MNNGNNSSKPLIIDTDCSLGIKGRDVDDGLAVVFAINSTELDIKGITKVYGNASLEKVSESLANLLDVYEKSHNTKIAFPRVKGSDQTLHKMDATFNSYFLCDCFENEKQSDFFYEHSITRKIREGELYPAVKFMADMIKEYPNDIIIAPIGPLTNIALLLKVFPEVSEDISKFSVMGGKLGGYEFNFVNDPVATNVVLKSSVPTQVAGIEICTAQMITQEHLDKVSEHNTILSSYLVDNCRPWLKLNRLSHLYRKNTGFYPFDLCAIINLVDEEIISYEEITVRQTIPTINWSAFNMFCKTLKVDEKRTDQKDKAVEWGTNINSDEFLEIVVQRLN